MPLNYPTLTELINDILAEFTTELPDVDPTVKGSWSRAFSKGTAITGQALSLVLRDLEKQFFPQNSTGEFLDLWGDYEGLTRIIDNEASGTIYVTGVATTVIPVDLILTYTNAEDVVTSYRTVTPASSIQSVTPSISSLIRVGSTAIATSSNHGLVTGVSVTIAGASPSNYNGTFTIQVTDTDEFQYTVAGSPTTPATGTITFAATYGNINIEAVEVGSSSNVNAAETLTFSNPPAGVSADAFSTFGGIADGTDEETDDEFRSRILISRRNISGIFTKDQILLAALSISGNTRIFVVSPDDVGATINNGEVAVFILRDNDLSILPSDTIIANTKAIIISDGKLPAHMSEDSVLVSAPDLITTAFTFSALDPNTATMQDAITNQLEAFFRDSVDFQVSVSEGKYLGAIQNTIDSSTGDDITSFTLSAPSGDITVTTDEIAALGTITFPT